MDDELVSESLSALLGLSQTNDGTVTAVSTDSAIVHLVTSRRISERRAVIIATEGKCDECTCLLGTTVTRDECECPCHCQCCCPPLFHCVSGCECTCECHYEAGASDDEANSNASIALAQQEVASPQGPIDQTAQECNTEIQLKRAALPDKMTSDATPRPSGLPTNDDEDEEMNGTAPLDVDLPRQSPEQLLALLMSQLDRNDDQAEANAHQVLKEIFARAFEQATSGGATVADVNRHLPTMTDPELTMLHDYVLTLRKALKYQPTRIKGAIRDVAVAAVRSKWKFEKIVQQRAISAKTPRDPPTNVWSQREGASSLGARTSQMPAFRFDETVYSEDEVERYRALCVQEHAFATATRTPTPDEWAILMGLMAGTIVASAMPQFLKRCCTFSQLVWVHEQIIHRAEGELWVPLSRLSKMYNFNQSTRRLVEEIRQSAAHQNWTEARLERMLSLVKSVVYNPELHSLHFFCFTKAEPLLFEGMQIPFRSSKLTLLNPDTKLTRSSNSAGLPTDDDDGLHNDRYQAHYKIRLVNVPRTFDLPTTVAYLQSLTNQGIKSGVPLDTYGQHADGSVMWDLFCQTAKCPEQLVEKYRIDWNGHPIILHHRPGEGQQPCLQCARVGHQTANCPTPKEQWNDTTLIVPSEVIQQHKLIVKPWKTLEDLQACFASLAPPSEPLTTPTAGIQDTLPTRTGLATGLNLSNEQSRDGDQSAKDVPDGASVTAPGPGRPPTTPPVGGTAQNSAPSPATSTAVVQPVPPPQSSSTVVQNGAFHQVNRGKPRRHTKQPTQSRVASAAPTMAPPSTNRFTELDDSDDEISLEDSTARSIDVGMQSTPTNPQPVPRQQPKANQCPSEIDALQLAIARARMERVRAAILSEIEDKAKPFDAGPVRTALSRARENITDRASVAWVLEAIGGRLTATPETGNCQPYAMVEALLQADIKLLAAPETITGITMLLKLGLLFAHQACGDLDRANNNIINLLELPTDLPVDLSEEEQQNLVTDFYKELALSHSAPTAILPSHLWGRLDTIRMAAKLLQRNIYLISKSTDPSNCFLNVIRRQNTKHGEEFIALIQPGVKEWLRLLEEDIALAGAAPIVLYHTGNHYNCVIFDRERPATAMPTSKKLKTVKLNDLWKPTTMTAPPDAPGQTQPPIAGTPRREVLQSNVRLEETDLLDFITDPSWTTAEKELAVKAILSDSANYRELLTTPDMPPPPVPSSLSTEQNDPTSDDLEYTPASNSSGSDSGPSQMSILESPTDGTYREWADEIWSGVIDEWLEQYNERLPTLLDQRGLVKLLRRSPQTLCEAGRWCDNPFVLLEHLTEADIKEWMESLWIAHCTQKVAALIESIMDADARPALDAWLERIRHAPKSAVACGHMRDKAAWRLLRQHAGEFLKGPMADPLLAPEYTIMHAYILVLDQLFPRLAGQVMSCASWTGDISTVSLVTAYVHAQNFRTVLQHAMEIGSWDPVVALVNQMELNGRAPPDRS